MAITYAINGPVPPSEMLSLATAAGFGMHRTLARNAATVAGSLFVATARRDGELVGLIRLIGDGAYVLHVADMMVHPACQRQGIGRQLLRLAMEFARSQGVGTGSDMGEFTLFAAPGAEAFYLKSGFVPITNGMCLADTDQRRADEAPVTAP